MVRQSENQIGEEEKWQIVGAAETSGELAEWRKLQKKNLKHTGPQRHRESNWKVCQSRLFQKEKGQSRLSRAPNCEVEESQGEREPHLGERERKIKAGARRGKGGIHIEERQVSRRKGRAGKESLPKEVDGSMRG